MSELFEMMHFGASLKSVPGAAPTKGGDLDRDLEPPIILP